MDIRISLTDGVPIYQQIVTQIRYQIAAGKLRPGVELPPIRSLAEQLQINPNTVARAYRELEQAGAVEKRSTKGTFVTESVTRLNTKHRQAILHERIDQLAAESHQLGFSLEQLLIQVNARWRLMEKKQSKDNSSEKAS
jgi:GntR family transcriptional regulator